MYMQRERDDLLKRLQPGTSRTADFTKAISRCFECADTVVQRRRDLSYNPALSPEQRKEELARLVTEDLLPHLAGLVQPAKTVKAIVESERRKLQYGNSLDKRSVELMNDAAVVDAALYFASRELAPAAGLSKVDFELLTQPGVSA